MTLISVLAILLIMGGDSGATGDFSFIALACSFAVAGSRGGYYGIFFSSCAFVMAALFVFVFLFNSSARLKEQGFTNSASMFRIFATTLPCISGLATLPRVGQTSVMFTHVFAAWLSSAGFLVSFFILAAFNTMVVCCLVVGQAAKRRHRAINKQ